MHVVKGAEACPGHTEGQCHIFTSRELSRLIPIKVGEAGQRNPGVISGLNLLCQESLSCQVGYYMTH